MDITKLTSKYIMEHPMSVISKNMGLATLKTFNLR